MPATAISTDGQPPLTTTLYQPRHYRRAKRLRKKKARTSLAFF